MKKSILLGLCILFAIPASLQAKNTEQRRYNDNYDYIDYKKSEIYIQYGAPSVIELTNKLETKTLEPLGLELAKTKYTGIGAVGYNFYLSPYISLGAYFGISEADMRLTDKKGHDVYTNHVRNYTGLLGISWTYFRSGIWEASCGAWLGVAQLDERQEILYTATSHDEIKIPRENDRYRFAYNLTATRIRVGGGVFGAFAEIGFGYKGLANVGLSVKF